jgi:hypothetical protein
MAARAFMEQVRTVILQRRVRETQSRSEPAGVFQSLIAHIMGPENREDAVRVGILGCQHRVAKSSCPL